MRVIRLRFIALVVQSFPHRIYGKTTTMFSPALLLLPVLVAFGNRPRIINFDKEIAEAKTIRYMLVMGYSDCTISVTYPGGIAPLVLDCKAKKIADPIRARSVEIYKEQAGLKGHWPAAGDSVLVVIGPFGGIRLYAMKKGKDYQFWDPNLDFLGSWFRFSPPARPTSLCAVSSADIKKEADCFDGCLYEINLLKEK